MKKNTPPDCASLVRDPGTALACVVVSVAKLAIMPLDLANIAVHLRQILAFREQKISNFSSFIYIFTRNSQEYLLFSPTF